ncbi:hypothetical protein ASC97_19205 [Rhizobium sp. Root1203]|uniref:dimethylsulfonioproprionate lyase family protein n=1 Tax=Rhizobium sp. Root1203 TaxID=1736427 RepID=UPI00070E9059|nr:dimethylsulfonioproprionate lyase family protein [Rhizobium sp. Root1203]KQV31498.1 hypothetical protein ASC97_19205 [Rhizobium sp. Root1203]
MPQVNRRAPTRSDDLLLLDYDANTTHSGGGRAGSRPISLQFMVNAMCSAMLAPDTPLMPMRVAAQVFEKLIRQGQVALGEGSQTPDSQRILDIALGNLDRQKGVFGELSRNLRMLAGHLVWAQGRSGPFASRNFESSHAHAVIVGPGGIEERTDVRIGLTIMAPYTRFPDHTQYQARAFLSLSPLEFCRESESWTKAGFGAVCYSGAGELVGIRCTTKPLLLLWCNTERP